MITGAVNASLEAVIAVYIEDGQGQTRPLQALIDTGFSGHLALPQALVAALGLTWMSRQQTMLGDGTIQVVDQYSAEIIWDTQLRKVPVSAVGMDALVGMKLLEGCEVRMRVVPGGLVVVDAVP